MVHACEIDIPELLGASKWIVYNVKEWLAIWFIGNYLVESDGKLLAVLGVYEDESPIHVFKLLPKLQLASN